VLSLKVKKYAMFGIWLPRDCHEPQVQLHWEMGSLLSVYLHPD